MCQGILSLLAENSDLRRGIHWHVLPSSDGYGQTPNTQTKDKVPTILHITIINRFSLLRDLRSHSHSLRHVVTVPATAISTARADVYTKCNQHQNYISQQYISC